MNQSNSRTHAIVIGGSLGGLLTARVLSQHFQRVTILERDEVPEQPEARKGQPQARHLHGLLATGLQTMTRYFPDLPQALVNGGAVMGDFAEQMQWYTYGGYRQRFHMGVPATTMSRPLLESLIRERVLALPNMRMMDNCGVNQLLITPDGQRVTGVEVALRHEGNQLLEVLADLVVDCTGRGSRSPQWLVEMGFDAPPVSEVKVNVAYATRLYRRLPTDPRGTLWTLITPEAPRESRFGAIFPIEGDRWIVSMGGWHGDHPPTDEAGFLAFARNLPAPDIYDIISQAEPLSDITPIKFPHSVRRHYEKLRRFPAGFLVLGDAISSFNPTYGQGMTSAALQAAELDDLLAKRTPPEKLALAFFKRTAKVVDMPWQLAVGEDFRFPQTSGPKPPGVDFINRYVSKVHRATLHDPVVGLALLKVMNLMAPPPSLFHPKIVWRVLRGKRPSIEQSPMRQPAAAGD
ncbi:MAG: FAD-binding monooxygenase [Chloroflexi bacterium]|nr:FAD-dependent monooxygenase [Ardenticatenaceae bacterium]MBL1130595.1 FAD-binding monooxygenase [Chloroflexota bacterium]NOG36687.1 FAD-binding monooxygenase [Chloroflexota bacterium]